MLPNIHKKPRPRRSVRHVPDGFQFLLEGNPHPLLIPCIVSEVASYLLVSDLKSFRQVCAQWNEEACKQLRLKAKIILQGEENLVAYTKLNSSAQSFHTNFELRGDLELGCLSVQTFFNTFGSQIKYVCFNRVKWKETELKDILFEKLPKLEELGLEARAYSDRRLFPGVSDHELMMVNSKLLLPKIRVLRLNIFSLMTEVTTPFLRDVLRVSPNVEVISSLKTSTIANPLPMPFIQYICQAMNYDTADDLVHMPYAADIAIAEAIIETKGLSLPKLACLDCNMRLRTPSLNQLALKGYPLRQLDLTVMSDVTSCTLQRLLSSVTNTLQVLKLKFQPGCPAAEEFVTPELKKLAELTLNGFKCSMKFLEYFPNLKMLTLIRINLQRALAMEAVQCEKPLELESFQVFEEFSMGGLAGDTIRLLALLFPRVRRLKLENLSDDSIVQVFAEFPYLEELNAMNGFYTDCGVTGIQKCIFNSSHSASDNVDLRRFKENPDISCMKNLRSLSLGSPKLTDYSILHGVALCKGIRRLHLLSNGITDVSLRKLSSELDLFYLKTEYCFQLTKDMVLYVKNQMKGRTLSLNEYTGPMKQSEIPKFMRRNGSLSVRLSKLDIVDTQLSPSLSSSSVLQLPTVPPNDVDDTSSSS
ncbi:hypothetical protein Ocin01_06859 [Orchesella cincta]|uniref:F-box domain-containing protein n=1 Tax=Orchesella cincta TaxID=48709 RepID=A0A1D2N3N4_ORCCI|nr:hypothetical protein Ocin01_06859 [Orchesella cincta]